MKKRETKEVLQILTKNGYEAYCVGGCVRDFLLGIPCNDVDITTNANPDIVMDLFERAIPTGIDYGTVTVIYKNTPYEITTYRSDILYKDHRHPEISFSKTVKEDIMRRDFTMNALLMDENGEIFDYVEGKKDLEKKLIRCIGNPMERFKEDPLRILRAIHFVSKLGFEIEKNTYEAMITERDLLSYISQERIQAEFFKISKGNNFLQAMKLLEPLSDVLNRVTSTKYIVENSISNIDWITWSALHFLMDETADFKKEKYSNKEKALIEEMLKQVNQENPFSDLSLYQFGDIISEYTRELYNVLHHTSISKEEIQTRYQELPIHDKSELSLSFLEIKSYFPNIENALLAKKIDFAIEIIIKKKLPNEPKILLDILAERSTYEI